jgi:spore maturation protein CgeB
MKKKIIIVGEYMWPWYQTALKNAFEELGHITHSFKWFDFFWIRKSNNQLKIKSLYHKIQYRLLIGPTIFRINYLLFKKIKKVKPDIIFLYSSTLILNYTLKRIKSLYPKIKICQYTNDSPSSSSGTFGLWRRFRANIRYCDYHFIFRENDREFFKLNGAKNINLLLPYYIPDKDYFIPLEKIPLKFHCDIVFAGHYEDDGRLELLEELKDKGYRLNLFGGGWNKALQKRKDSPLRALMPIYSVTELDYNYAICGSKIAICFLSKINNDSYTRRNFEIPAMRKVLISEYSDNLNKMFIEDKEMVFFRNKSEFFKKIEILLNKDIIRNEIELNLKNFRFKKHSVIDRAKQILEILDTEDNDSKLVPISFNDIENLRIWKNYNKNYFFLKDEITKKEQINWFKNIYLKEKNNQIFIIKHKDIEIGTLGYRLKNNSWDIYNVMNINDNFRGKGIMSISLKKLIVYLINKKDIDITAKVLTSNNNINWYLKNNFDIIDENKNFYQVKYRK